MIGSHSIELERPFAGLALDRALLPLAPLTIPALAVAALDRPGMVGLDRGVLFALVQTLCLRRGAREAQYNGAEQRFHQVCTSLRWRCTLIRMPAPMKSVRSAVPP